MLSHHPTIDSVRVKPGLGSQLPILLPADSARIPYIDTSDSFAHFAESGWRRLGTLASVGRREHIFREGEPANLVYLVEEGVLLSYAVTASGQRVVSEFYLPGDIVALEVEGLHQTSCQAVRNATVRAFDREAFLAAARTQDALSRAVWARMFAEQLRREEHIILLGMSAIERVCGFILSTAARCHSHEIVDLPMSRRDIADFLTLTIETVSRMVTFLRGERAIRLETVHRLRILNRPYLEQVSGRT
jgi:CRP-like cAMP-binding protein